MERGDVVGQRPAVGREVEGHGAAGDRRLAERGFEAGGPTGMRPAIGVDEQQQLSARRGDAAVARLGRIERALALEQADRPVARHEAGSVPADHHDFALRRRDRLLAEARQGAIDPGGVEVGNDDAGARGHAEGAR